MAAMVSRKKNVLVVDDDPSMLSSIGRLLRVHGYGSKLFGSAQAVLHHPDYEEAFCIIMDINLGDGFGVDVQRQLVDSGVSLPVIYITGNDSARARSSAMESGCMAYLTKPFAAKALIDPVERAFASAA